MSPAANIVAGLAVVLILAWLVVQVLKILRAVKGGS